jgi:hypothetical protein
MDQQKQDQLVLATKIITPILLVTITGSIAFWYYRKQKQIQKFHEEEISKLESDKAQLEESIEEVEEKLEAKQEELQHAVFDDVDENGQIVENAEFASMRERYVKEEPQRVHRSIFDTALVSDPNVNDGAVTQEEIDAFEAEQKRKEKKAHEIDVMSSEYKKEEDSIKMIHERNSSEAYQAFIDRMIVDIDFDDPEGAHRTYVDYGLDFKPGEARDVELLIRSLFSVEAEVTNDYDRNVEEVLMDERINYFGEDSIYSKGNASIAEYLIYWAYRLSEDTNNSSVWAYLAQFINNMDLYNSNGMTPFEMKERVALIMEHSYYTRNGLFGIFGLNNDMLDSIAGAEKQFRTQFNAFLGDIIDYNEAIS